MRIHLNSDLSHLFLEFRFVKFDLFIYNLFIATEPKISERALESNSTRAV